MDNKENNGLDESNIDMASTELHDLTKFWNGLSLWERDQSIITVEDFLGRASLCSSDTSTKQFEKMRENIKFFSLSNHIEKQSQIKSLLIESSTDLTNEQKKPNFNACMEIILSLSREELLNLGDYMGMNKARLSLIKSAELCRLYEETLTTKSIAVFFAVRNYLGKK